jgi:17beta-estradiol 17-dehydrogenase / very-long-chain 3-oxoacyl-CoA reductase
MLCWVFYALQYLLITLGAVVLGKATWAVFTFVKVANTKLNEEWAERYGKGSWVIVTGCTEGIGKAFCSELAKLGFNLVLVSRNLSKLQALQKSLDGEYPNLMSKVVQADFSNSNRGLYEYIHNETSNLDVSILVNNVGISHISTLRSTLETFDEQSLKEV